MTVQGASCISRAVDGDESLEDKQIECNAGHNGDSKLIKTMISIEPTGSDI